MNDARFLIFNLFALGALAAPMNGSKLVTHSKIHRVIAASPIFCHLYDVNGTQESKISSGELKDEWVTSIDAQSKVTISGDLQNSTLMYVESTNIESEYSVSYQISCDLSLNCNATKTTKKHGKSVELHLSILGGGSNTRAFNQERELFRFERTVRGFNYHFIQNHSKNGDENGFKVNCES